MNTRLQVEHPVTEMVTGLDLVELQILAAHGEPLPVTQQDITFTGHAFEARINAENPATGFTPQTGTISHLRVPHDVRWDSAVEVGSEATPYYDSMIAKLITTGPDRESARLRLAETLEEILIGGFTTTTGFHRWLINQPALINSTITTRYLDETPVPDPPAPPAGMAAAAWKASRRAEAPSDAWHQLHLFRNSDQTAFDPVILEDQSGAIYEVEPHGWAWTGTHLFDVADQVGRHTAAVDTNAGLVWVNLDGHTFSFNALTRSEHWAAKATDSLAALEDAIVAPFPAVVSEVLVAPGDELTPDDPVVVIEAMKMLHTLSTPSRAVVAAVRVEVGDQVESGQVPRNPGTTPHRGWVGSLGCGHESSERGADVPPEHGCLDAGGPAPGVPRRGLLQHRLHRTPRAARRQGQGPAYRRAAGHGARPVGTGAGHHRRRRRVDGVGPPRRHPGLGSPLALGPGDRSWYRATGTR